MGRPGQEAGIGSLAVNINMIQTKKRSDPMPKLAIILGPDSDALRQRLADMSKIAMQLGGAVQFKTVDTHQTLEEMAKQCEGAIALHPAVYRQMTPEQITDLVKRVPSIKLIQTASAGTDLYQKVLLDKMGVPVCNNGGANAVAVAEHAIAFMVSIYHRLDQQMDSVRAGTWQAPIVAQAEEDFHTLVGKRVGIVGLGRIGSRVAKRLQGWECEVVYHDIAEFTHEYVSAARTERVDFHQLLRTCDVVTVHVPLEPTTKHMMSDKEFSMMKASAIFINTCRGPVVDEAALARALEKRTIYGAAIDVTEVEPIPMDSPLLKLKNIIITPHLATRAIESTENAKRFVVENILRLARGEKLESIVNPVEM